jgi:hypothetical protein
VIGNLFCKIKDIYKQQKKEHKQTNAVLRRKNKRNNKSITVNRKLEYDSWGTYLHTHLGKYIPCKDITKYAKARIFIAKKFADHELQHACLDFTTAHFLATKTSVIDKNHWIRIAQTEYVSLQDIQSHINRYVCDGGGCLLLLFCVM